MHKDKHIEWRLIIGKLQNKCSEEEEATFKKWYESDPENRVYFEKAVSYFERYYSGSTDRIIDKDAAWQEFLAYTHPIHHGRRLRMLRYAAMISLPLIGSCLAYLLLTQSPESDQRAIELSQPVPGETKAVLVLGNGQKIQLSGEVRKDTLALESNVIINQGQQGLQYNKLTPNEASVISNNTVITPRGGEYQVKLSDGTKVTLNAESKLIFPVEFTGNLRRVQLTGEAYFEVTPDAKAPFIVETMAGKIKVLGTSFNVSAYFNDDVVQTTLVSGSVSFTQPGRTEGSIIKPGEQISYHKTNQTIQIQQVNTEAFCSWRNGLFVVEAQRLEDIMKRIARWYDVEVFFVNPETKNLVFTGDLEKYEKCDVILKIIELSTHVKFTLKGRTVTVMTQQ